MLISLPIFSTRVLHVDICPILHQHLNQTAVNRSSYARHLYVVLHHTFTFVVHSTDLITICYLNGTIKLWYHVNRKVMSYKVMNESCLLSMHLISPYKAPLGCHHKWSEAQSIWHIHNHCPAEQKATIQFRNWI